ncbi:MAG: exodeoxyribonuclease VII large subunit [Syntrophales bacterium]|nr:exodeoxyribonuclease VII large subunit [Syntrophales bacterium]
MAEIWTVTKLNEAIKDLLEVHFGVLWVEGEISNLRKPPSGHTYFTLKDDRGQIRAVLFQPSFGKGRWGAFVLEDGMHIVCRARLSAYTPRGEYQLIVEAVEPRGLGALQKAFEQLQARLRAEGLFDAAHKKPLPFLPAAVGIITSPSGAVIQDIINIATRRFPSVRLILAPVRVQGLEAPDEIVQALADFNTSGFVDVIIIARGGGSLEDLYPFNTEAVARAVFASRIPVVSAIGHETDFTITDFVADLRAPTPSAAAELVLPLHGELVDRLTDVVRRLHHAMRRQCRERIVLLTNARHRLRDPRRVLMNHRLRLTALEGRLGSALERALAQKRRLCHEHILALHRWGPREGVQKKRLIVAALRSTLTERIRGLWESKRRRYQALSASLAALNPLAVLHRGYAVAQKYPEGWIVRRAAALVAGDDVLVRVGEGRFTAAVKIVYQEDRDG